MQNWRWLLSSDGLEESGEHERVCYGDQIREGVMGLKRWGRVLSLAWDTPSWWPWGPRYARAESCQDMRQKGGRAGASRAGVPWWRWRGLVHSSLIRPPRPPHPPPCKNGVLSVKIRRAIQMLSSKSQCETKTSRDVGSTHWVRSHKLGCIELHGLLVVALILQ